MLGRRRRPAVRLLISARPDRRIKAWLTEWLHLGPEEVYEIDGPLDAAALMEIANWPGFENLRNADWPPQPPRDLIGRRQPLGGRPGPRRAAAASLRKLRSRGAAGRTGRRRSRRAGHQADALSHQRRFADRPRLGRAAQNGKEVTVLVELRARFDETRNVRWARRLEDAGCHVIYGIAGYKTHGKALLIVRRQQQRIQRYVHLSTGNYNDKTARLYSDIGLMTTDRDIAADVAAFFNLLTGCSEAVGWMKLCIAPTGLRQRFLDLIDREIQVSTPDRPGLIMAKLNSLQDTRDLPGAVPRQPGRRQGAAQCARHLLLAAGGVRRLGKYRSPLDHRPFSRTCPRLLLSQRRPRGGLPRQRRLDDPQSGQAAGDSFSR